MQRFKIYNEDNEEIYSDFGLDWVLWGFSHSQKDPDPKKRGSYIVLDEGQILGFYSVRYSSDGVEILRSAKLEDAIRTAKKMYSTFGVYCYVEPI